jgi:hypothetical protein
MQMSTWESAIGHEKERELLDLVMNVALEIETDIVSSPLTFH